MTDAYVWDERADWRKSVPLRTKVGIKVPLLIDLGQVVKSGYTRDLKSLGRKVVRVQLPPCPLLRYLLLKIIGLIAQSRMILLSQDQNSGTPRDKKHPSSLVKRSSL